MTFDQLKTLYWKYSYKAQIADTLDEMIKFVNITQRITTLQFTLIKRQLAK